MREKFTFYQGHRSAQRMLSVLGSLIFIGCGKEEIKVYSVPKEVPAEARPAMAQNEISANPNASTIHWETPAGWKELAPTEMRVGNFLVTSGEKKAEVSIVPLSGGAGTELGNVNRWRNEISLSPIAENEIVSEKISIGASDGKLYELTGAQQKTIAAVLEREGTSWFFKMRGDKEIVSQNKPVFVEFLKAINFNAAKPAEALVAAKPVSTNIKKVPNEGSSGEPKWEVPANWQEKPPSEMVLKSFSVGDADHEAKVSVTTFSGSGGSLLMNVNRWRKQLSLDPVAESDVAKLTTPIDVLGGKATLVDMNGTDAKTGKPAHLIAATVPRKEKIWFYKLMGDEATVAREKDAFVKFVQSVHYPND